jgi:hypothetical protein
MFLLPEPALYYNEDLDFILQGFNTNKFYPDSENVRLYTSFMLSTASRENFFHIKAGTHLLSNYHDFYVENSRVNTFHQILGMAQLSAAGYLAYRHIKKYGLK